MTATHSLDSTASTSPVLYLTFELSNGQWKLASTTARGQAARLVSVPAGDKERVLAEIARGIRYQVCSSLTNGRAALIWLGCANGQKRRPG